MIAYTVKKIVTLNESMKIQKNAPLSPTAKATRQTDRLVKHTTIDKMVSTIFSRTFMPSPRVSPFLASEYQHERQKHEQGHEQGPDRAYRDHNGHIMGKWVRDANVRLYYQ
jgi:hypothetical protein